MSKKIAICLDDLYANRDVRYYVDYVPALRSERSGLKVVEKQIEFKLLNKDNEVVFATGDFDVAIDKAETDENITGIQMFVDDEFYSSCELENFLLPQQK